MNFDPGDLEKVLSFAETAVGDFEQIPKRSSCTSDQHNLVGEVFCRNLSFQEL